MKQMLHRGVGVHHAGLLPKYRRVVEDLFLRKLLAVRHLHGNAGIGHQPAGPLGRAGVAGQGTVRQGKADRRQHGAADLRPGRPAAVRRSAATSIALAHEDDVKILRWKEKFDQIPEDTRDPGLLKAKKDLKRKKPTRSDTRTYWSEGQFKQLQAAPPGKLYSKGPLPWRLLAYLLKISPEVSLHPLGDPQTADGRATHQGRRTTRLDRMLLTLARAGYVTLEPEPPQVGAPLTRVSGRWASARGASGSTMCNRLLATSPSWPTPTAKLDQLLVFRSIHPLYGAFLLQHLGIADRNERLQALESVLEMPRSVLRYVRVPCADDLPPGPLATTRLDEELIRRGLMIAKPSRLADDEEDERRSVAAGTSRSSGRRRSPRSCGCCSTRSIRR